MNRNREIQYVSNLFIYFYLFVILKIKLLHYSLIITKGLKIVSCVLCFICVKGIDKYLFLSSKCLLLIN